MIEQPQANMEQEVPQQVEQKQRPIEKTVVQDAANMTLMLKMMSKAQREQAYPQMVQALAQQDERVLEILDPTQVPTDEDLDRELAPLKKEQSPVFEKKFEQERAKSQAKTIDTAMKEAEDARQMLQTADQYEGILDQYPDVVGKFSGIMKTARSVGERVDQLMGTDIADEDKLAAAEALENLTMNFVMNRIKGTKGAISEKEMKAFRESVANAENTLEGNKRILSGLREVENAKIRRAEFLNNYAGVNGSLDGVETAWEEEKKRSPLFASLEERKFKGKTVTRSEFIKQFRKQYPDAPEDHAEKMFRTLKVK